MKLFPHSATFQLTTLAVCDSSPLGYIIKVIACLSSSKEKFAICIRGFENWIVTIPLESIDRRRIFRSGFTVLFLLKRDGSILNTDDYICFRIGSGIIAIGTWIILDFPLANDPVIITSSVLGFSIIPKSLRTTRPSAGFMSTVNVPVMFASGTPLILY